MNIELENLAQLLRDRFVTRSDCYAKQIDDGYSKVLKDLTKDEILKHLDGKKTLGVYLLDLDNNVKFLAIDVDLKKSEIEKIEQYRPVLRETARKILRIVSSLNIDCILEDSGHRGYHILVFFDKPVAAAKAKQLGKYIQEKVGKLPEKVDIEIFPKQDRLSEKPYGNLLKLPLGVHKKSGKRSEFLDPETFKPVDDALDVLANVGLVGEDNLKDLVPSAAASALDSSSSMELDQNGLENMQARCPIVNRFEKDPTWVTYDQWLGLGSNYVVFKGGWERFVEVSKWDAKRYEKYEIDRIQEEVLGFHGPQTYEKFRDQGVKSRLPASSPKSPAGWGSWGDPMGSPIHVQGGCYGKYSADKKFQMLAPFTIEPKELLVLPDGDVLNGTVKHTSGREWENVTIENTDWHNRSKFMKALAHSECTFHGYDVDLINLCQYVIQQVSTRKEGTRIIGLHDDTWAIKGCNLNASGYVEPMALIPYDRSSESLHSRVVYQHVEDSDYKELLQTLFSNLLKVNIPEVILPILGWFFAVPLKSRIIDHVGSFPILFCYGTQGGGKTSLLETLMSLHGYQDATVYSCTMKQFPMLRLLSSTNAVPVVLDEYKPHDMREAQVSELSSIMRRIYKGEIEEKGTKDQTSIGYEYQAPLCVCGEDKVTQSAILERVLIAGFTDAIKKSAECQKAFREIENLDLQGFMDRYVIFCLGADVSARWTAQSLTQDALKEILGSEKTIIAPRILKNLTTMTFGLELLKDFAAKWGMDLHKEIKLQDAITAQLEEITGDCKGEVKLAVDIMLEQLAIMAEKGLIKKYVEFNYVNLRDKDEKKVFLALRLKVASQALKANSRIIGFDGEILGDASYLKQLKTRGYVEESNHPVRFKCQNSAKEDVIQKCVVIDLEKAKKVGLELEGFDTISKEYGDDQTEKKSEL